MTDECYWDYPLKGVNGKKENGSKKYRDYYFDNNGELTSQQVADHFGLAKITIDQHRSNYQWDMVLADKQAYETRKRREKREQTYEKHIEKDYSNANTVLNIKYTQIQMAAVKVGIMQPTPGLYIPDELTFEKAWDTINRTDLKTLQTVIMRDLEKSGTINDKQKIESENINTNLNIPLKTTDEVLDENADTITRFIERRMHTTDSTTD
jgi:hypothetical protein